MSKINLWMKSCKQLESEKQALQEEHRQQGQQIAALQASQKQGMNKTHKKISAWSNLVNLTCTGLSPYKLKSVRQKIMNMIKCIW